MIFFKKNPTAEPTAESKLLNGLRKTRAILTTDLRDLISGRKPIDEAMLEELETRLLMTDMGIATTDKILEALRKQISLGSLQTLDSLLTELKILLEKILILPKPLPLTEHKPFSILVVGINGSGKTTTIGKLAHHYQQAGYQVMLAAGDTFRAAAVEQLQTWGERNQIPVIAQGQNADPAAVIYDALQSAQAKKIDILLADTAGRLHTQKHLMAELEKTKRVMQKLDPAAPHEVFLVLDASLGQNALHQARQFHQALGVTGLIVTKLDGTAKGGIVFAIQQELKLPVYYLGVGEGIDDLQAFQPEQFVEALLKP